MMGKPINIAALSLKKYSVLLPIAVFLLVALWLVSPVSLSQEEKVFVVQKGENLSQVAQNLEKQGLIRNAFAFKIFGLTQGMAAKIQAGDFRLKPAMNNQQIMQALSHGTADTWMTFPEGWRREEYSRRLAVNLTGFDEQAFLALTKNSEGKLFPDTYAFPKDASPAAVVKILTANFAAKTKDLRLTQAALILASIVEREAPNDLDRPIIAGILLKRQQKGWALQADATLQYAKANIACRIANAKCDWWPVVAGADKNVNSLYNTYKYLGLPPGPIANPGLASLRAALAPQASAYWFYLSDAEGQIHYAATLEEHQQNIARYLR